MTAIHDATHHEFLEVTLGAPADDGRRCLDVQPHRVLPSADASTGSSTQGIKTVLHPVSDLENGQGVYAALLGVAPADRGVLLRRL